MMSRNSLTLVAVFLLAVILISSSIYTVGEAEKAIKFQLGEILDLSLIHI